MEALEKLTTDGPIEAALWKQLRGGGHSAEYLLDLFGIEEPPVPVIGIAQGIGVEVYYRPGAPWAGLLSIEDDGSTARIFVKKEDPTTRQRFTVAHELGHLLLHKDVQVHRDNDYSNYVGRSRSKEREANHFAAELLMPAWMVKFAFDHMELALTELAHLFEVSQEAMHYRLKDLGLITTY